MLFQILALLLNAVFSLIGFALLARFALQWARAPFRNPVGSFVIAITDWVVRPARRIIPSAWGHDLPSLVLAWLSQFLYQALLYALSLGFVHVLGHAGTVALLALVETAKLACQLAFAILIIGVVLSWLNPRAPLAPLFNALAEPLLRPFRRLIPPIGGVDLSPIGPLLLIQVLQLLLAYAQGALTPGLLS